MNNTALNMLDEFLLLCNRITPNDREAIMEFAHTLRPKNKKEEEQ